MAGECSEKADDRKGDGDEAVRWSKDVAEKGGEKS